MKRDMNKTQDKVEYTSIKLATRGTDLLCYAMKYKAVYSLRGSIGLSRFFLGASCAAQCCGA